MEIVPMEIVMTVLNLIITGLVGWVLKAIKASHSRMINQLKLVRIDVQAMDYALEMESANGYCGYRDTKKQELIANENFINKAA